MDCGQHPGGKKCFNNASTYMHIYWCFYNWCIVSQRLFQSTFVTLLWTQPSTAEISFSVLLPSCWQLTCLFVSINVFVHTTQVAVTSIVIFVILPLTLVGTVLGRNLNGAPNVPCRVNTVPRPIPEKKW